MSKKTIVTILILIAIILAAYFILLGPEAASSPKDNGTAGLIKNNMDQTNTFDIQGMKVEVLKQGSGDAAKAGDTVSVNYVGTLENGTKFDSSIDRGVPFSFTLGQNRVIQGWELGVNGMKAGEKRKLTIPYTLAYGENGIPNAIPQKATLIFEVDLLGIN